MLLFLIELAAFAVFAGGAGWFFYYDLVKVNGGKRHKHREIEIRVYKSLIIAAGIMAVMILMQFAEFRGVEKVLGLAITLLLPSFLAVVAILVISVIGLFRCSWSVGGRLLLWYACLFTLFRMNESIAPPVKLEIGIGILGVLVLLTLPVIWLRNALRS